MDERRSLNSALKMTPKEALSPAAAAFIAGGLPEKLTPEILPKIKRASTPTGPVEIPESVAGGSCENFEREPKETTRPRRGSKAQQPAQAFQDKLLIPVTTRFDYRTAAALRRANLEQRLKGENPATLQEIVQIAVQAWLRENDYLE